MNPPINAPMIIGEIWYRSVGAVIFENLVHPPPPEISAASYRSFEIPCSNPEINKNIPENPNQMLITNKSPFTVLTSENQGSFAKS